MVFQSPALAFSKAWTNACRTATHASCSSLYSGSEIPPRLVLVLVDDQLSCRATPNAPEMLRAVLHPLAERVVRVSLTERITLQRHRRPLVKRKAIRDFFPFVFAQSDVFMGRGTIVRGKCRIERWTFIRHGLSSLYCSGRNRSEVVEPGRFYWRAGRRPGSQSDDAATCSNGHHPTRPKRELRSPRLSAHTKDWSSACGNHGPTHHRRA